MLVWDQVGDRRYQAGIDRGVLYGPRTEDVSSRIVVVWNGLVSVQESVEQEVKPFYLDGVKYLESHTLGEYSSKLQAYTYPDELDELVGLSPFVPGVFMHDQSRKPFDLCYRTLIGNDLDGTEHGYKLHILYNVMAVPSPPSFGSLSDSVGLTPFEWSLSSTPSSLVGARPTAHVSLDSRLIDPDALEFLEDLLYGVSSYPELPSLIDLMGLIETEAWA